MSSLSDPARFAQAQACDLADTLQWFGMSAEDAQACASEDTVPQNWLVPLIDPPAFCPGCLALAGQDWPPGASSRFCGRCRDQLRRVHQVKRWNRDRAHQVMAGKARARQFTHEYQSVAGLASFSAFSARWRAVQGIAPLYAEDARRYLTPEMIRDLGRPLPVEMTTIILQAWRQGMLYGVPWWTPERLAAFAERHRDDQPTLFDADTLRDLEGWR